MAHSRLFPLRTPLVLGATVVALAASAMPAYAGGDDCGSSAGPEAGDSSLRHPLGGDACPPAPAPARPTPVPAQPQPAPATPVPVIRAPAQPKTSPRPATPRPVTTQRPVTTPVTQVQTRQVTQQAFVARTVPRGGVQTGAGGTAVTDATRRLPALAIAALLLGLLSFGSGLRALQLKPRR
jgi:hypothetical protein